MSPHKASAGFSSLILIVIKLIYNISPSFSKTIESMKCGLSLPSWMVLPCKGRVYWQHSNFFYSFDLVLTVYDKSQIYLYIYFEMTIVNKFISIFCIEQHWILGLPFYNASTVVISRAKSRFADSILVYRWSVKIALPLIECSFSMPLTRYFTSR